MSLFDERCANAKFDGVTVENSVLESLVSTLVMSGPDQHLFTASDTLLPVDQIVRLMKDIPELSLSRGELGVVASIWCAPIVAYEVEFYQVDEGFPLRVLVSPKDLRAEPGNH